MSVENEIKKFEKERSLKMASFICLLVVVIGIVMLILNTSINNLKVIPITIAYTVLMGFTLLVLFITKKITWFYVDAIILVFMLEISFLFNGGSEGFGILWMTLVPIFAVYVLDINYYFALNSIVLFFLILGFWTPLNQYCYEFNEAFETRYPLLFFVEAFFGLFLKKHMKQTEDNLESQTNILAQELNQAAVIQENFYHHIEQEYKGWDVGYVLKPMAAVTGDLYDLYDRNLELDGVGIFDISGHGISSGLVTMLVKNIIQQEFYAGREYTLDQVMELIDGRVIEEKGNIDNYLTGILIRIKENLLEVVNAGHPFPLIFRSTSESFEVLQKDPQSRGAIGFSELAPVFITQEVTLNKNDEIILFTDGIFDIKNAEGKSFTISDFKEILSENTDRPAKEQINLLLKRIDEFRGEVEQTDDLTVLILKKEED